MSQHALSDTPHLPVVDEAGKLIGVLTLDDIMDLLCSEFEEIGKLIRKESPDSLGKL